MWHHTLGSSICLPPLHACRWRHLIPNEAQPNLHLTLLIPGHWGEPFYPFWRIKIQFSLFVHSELYTVHLHTFDSNQANPLGLRSKAIKSKATCPWGPCSKNGLTENHCGFIIALCIAAICCIVDVLRRDRCLQTTCLYRHKDFSSAQTANSGHNAVKRADKQQQSSVLPLIVQPVGL